MASLWAPEITENPFAFVMFAFPWGKKGTPLEKFTGPRTWQKEEMLQIAAHVQENKRLMAQGKEPKVYKSATVSGRGSGKSTLVAWMNLWMMTCHRGSSSVTTANTEAQLKSKTWAELGKWHTLLVNSHWFEKSVMGLKPAPWFEEALKEQLKIDTGYYYANATLWSEENPDAFAGHHNMAGVLLIMDEASGIPQAIWGVSEGYFTEPTLHRYWLVFSNGRRNTGAFFECFHKFRKFWHRRHIDSRTVEGVALAVYAEIIEKYGEDSDEARVEVKGEFPRQGDKQFISRELVSCAVARETVDDLHAPLIMGVDVARFGDDCSVIRFRKGRNARVIPPVERMGFDNMELADLVASLINKYDPDAVCIDGGNGSGVIDRLKQRGYRVHEVLFGAKSRKPEYANFRTYIWAEMREWLAGGCIDGHDDLVTDLTAPEYKFQSNSDAMRLQTKEELKAAGFSSPDHGDALACTFAVQVARRDIHVSRTGSNRAPRIASGSDYRRLG